MLKSIFNNNMVLELGKKSFFKMIFYSILLQRSDSFSQSTSCCSQQTNFSKSLSYTFATKSPLFGPLKKLTAYNHISSFIAAVKMQIWVSNDDSGLTDAWGRNRAHQLCVSQRSWMEFNSRWINIERNFITFQDWFQEHLERNQKYQGKIGFHNNTMNQFTTQHSSAPTLPTAC